MSSGKSAGHARTRDRVDRFGQRGPQLVESRRRRPGDRCPHVRHQRGETGVVERLTRPVKEVGAALVVDRRGR